MEAQTVCAHAHTRLGSRSKESNQQVQIPRVLCNVGRGSEKEIKTVCPYANKERSLVTAGVVQVRQLEWCRLDSWRGFRGPGKVSLEEDYSWQRHSCLEWVSIQRERAKLWEAVSAPKTSFVFVS